MTERGVLRWTLPLVLVVAGIVCFWQAMSHARAAAAVPASTAGTATPVVSLRRLPVALADLVADQRLALHLQDALADPSVAGSQVCLEASVGGSTVFGRDPQTPLIPASNLKLLTADVALRRLGANSAFTTSVVASHPAGRGVVDGPLWLVGGGDPLLATAGFRATQKEWTESVEPTTSLDELANRIRAAGITRIAGGIVGDDSRYDHERSLPSWKASYLSSGEIGGVGALVVDGGFTTSGSRRAAAADPAATAAQALTTLLQAKGVTVDAPASTGTAPKGAAQVASIASLALTDIVGVMLRESDNLAAEMLTKELGFRFGGSGSWAAGLQVIHDELAAAHIPLDGMVQVDGSGLDRSDRVSCQTLAYLTSSADPSAQLAAAALPTAGNCGTLVKRFLRGPAAGRIRAKTGSLSGVAALTGYVAPAATSPPPPCPPGAPPGDRTETFALLVNGVRSDAVGTAIEDRIANALASFPEAPVLGPFGPVGAA